MEKCLLIVFYIPHFFEFPAEWRGQKGPSAKNLKKLNHFYFSYFWRSDCIFYFSSKKPFCTTRQERKDSKSVKQILFHYMGGRHVLSCLSSLQLLYLLYMFISSYLSKYSPVSSMYYCIHSTFTWDIKRRLNLCLHNNSDLKVQTK